MSTVDRHLDSYSWNDFKKRKYWLRQRMLGDDSLRLRKYNQAGYKIYKYPGQPIDNEYQFYAPFKNPGRFAQRELRVDSKGRAVIEPYNFYSWHRPRIDKERGDYSDSKYMLPHKSRYVMFGGKQSRDDEKVEKRRVAYDRMTPLQRGKELRRVYKTLQEQAVRVNTTVAKTRFPMTVNVVPTLVPDNIAYELNEKYDLGSIGYQYVDGKISLVHVPNVEFRRTGTPPLGPEDVLPNPARSSSLASRSRQSKLTPEDLADNLPYHERASNEIEEMLRWK